MRHRRSFNKAVTGKTGVTTNSLIAPRGLSPFLSSLFPTPNTLNCTWRVPALPAHSKAVYSLGNDFLLGMFCTPRRVSLILISVAFQSNKTTAWALAVPYIPFHQYHWLPCGCGKSGRNDNTHSSCHLQWKIWRLY